MNVIYMIFNMFTILHFETELRFRVNEKTLYRIITSSLFE